MKRILSLLLITTFFLSSFSIYAQDESVVQGEAVQEEVMVEEVIVEEPTEEVIVDEVIDAETGDVIKREFDLSTGDQINLNVWEYIGHDGDYSNVSAKKASNDGTGTR